MIGASGCGKSSLALAISGLIPRAIEAEQSGTVLLNGIDIQTLAPGEACQTVGLVFQDPESQFCMLTVEDEIAFGLENAQISRGEICKRIDEALDMVQLGGYQNALIHRLSGGMKQRVALACVLALKPALLILDEPTANLDPAATEDFFTLLAQLAKSKDHTIIVIEHKLEHMASFVDRVLVLDQGAAVADGAPQNIFKQQSQFLKSLGIWQPYASELAGEARKLGHEINPYPLTVKDLTATARKNPSARSCIEKIIKGSRVIYSERQTRSFESPALQLEKVSFSYKTPFQRSEVLKEIHWQVEPGSFVALLGANGAGKSTLSKLALGLLKPDQGKISLFGKDVSRLPQRELTQLAGLVFQNPEHQFITDSVWEELAFSLKLANKSNSEIVEITDHVLEEFSLTHKADANPFTLSQGEKRRLSVASMLAIDQKLLILDEPSFGQDYTNTYKLMNLVQQRQQAGCTIIVSTHDLRLVWEYATEVVLLSEQKIGFSGSVVDLFQRDALLAKTALRQPPALQILREFDSCKEMGVS